MCERGVVKILKFNKMKTKVIIIVSLIFGFLLGIILSGIIFSVSSGEMMVKEIKSPYDFDKTVELLTARINQKAGWRVTSIIDQDKAVTENGGFPIGKYKIIQYCSGSNSAEMLKADNRKKMGVLMPKTFAVYEKLDGQVFVSTMNGAVMGKLFGGDIERIIENVSLDVEGMIQFLNFKFSLF